MMSSHLTLPWSWSDCDDPNKCEKVAHVPFDAETANSYPREWIESSAQDWAIDDDSICQYNDKNQLHNEAGPAIEYPDGTTEWRVNGHLHRENGPARKHLGGDTEWWLNGELHRIGGPAIEYADRIKEWRVKGKVHRLDGPAREHADGRKEWWVDGIPTGKPKSLPVA